MQSFGQEPQSWNNFWTFGFMEGKPYPQSPNSKMNHAVLGFAASSTLRALQGCASRTLAQVGSKVMHKGVRQINI